MFALNAFIKYTIEGLAVAVAVYLVAGQKSTMNEIILLGLTAGVTFMILDLFTAGIGMSARQGAGFGIGIKEVGYLGGIPGLGLGEGFDGGSDAGPTELNVSDKQPNYRGFTVGEDVYGDRIGYDPETQQYGRQVPTKKEIPKIDYLAETPYRFPNVYSKTCPQFPVAGSPDTDYYGATRTGSRWMGWVEDGKPVNCNTDEYKIVPGLYSKYIVQPGYHEGIKTSNSDFIDELAPTIWPTTNPLDKKYFLLREPFSQMTNEEKKNDDFSVDMAGGGLVFENFENPQTIRLSDVLYSGDIIDVTSGDTIMQRGLVNSQIMFDKPLPNVRTNLSKVRFILAGGKHDPRKQTPIRYGDPVYLKHNAMINNMNESRFIKYGDRLQSHQEGPLFRVYKIFNKKEPKSQDYIRYGDDLLIAKGDQMSDKIYLKIEPDKSVTSESVNSDASTFGITLERVYELYDRNLCVCPRETLYP